MSFKIRTDASGNGQFTIDSTDVLSINTNTTVSLPTGTANGVAYLNGSKVLTSGSGLVFDSSGNLGIGRTTSDGYRLATYGSTQITSGYQLTYGGVAAGSFTITSGGAMAFGLDNSTGGTERMRLDSSGNLGIGTASPASRLDVRQANAKDATTSWQLLSFDTTSQTIGVGGGITFGGYKTAQSAGEYFAAIDGYKENSTAGNAAGALRFHTQVSLGSGLVERMRLDSSGNLIVPAIYPNVTVSAANLYMGPTGTFERSTSSIKYKTDVESIEEQYVTNILNVRPVWYRSLCANDNPTWGYWGLIAEEVAEIDPRLVFWKTEEIREVTEEVDGESVARQELVKLETPEADGVQYDRFVPLLIKAIQLQAQTIESLTQRIEALEAKGEQ